MGYVSDLGPHTNVTQIGFLCPNNPEKIRFGSQLVDGNFPDMTISIDLSILLFKLRIDLCLLNVIVMKL